MSDLLKLARLLISVEGDPPKEVLAWMIDQLIQQNEDLESALDVERELRLRAELSPAPKEPEPVVHGCTQRRMTVLLGKHCIPYHASAEADGREALVIRSKIGIVFRNGELDDVFIYEG